MTMPQRMADDYREQLGAAIGVFADHDGEWMSKTLNGLRQSLQHSRPELRHSPLEVRNLLAVVGFYAVVAEMERQLSEHDRGEG